MGSSPTAGTTKYRPHFFGADRDRDPQFQAACGRVRFRARFADNAGSVVYLAECEVRYHLQKLAGDAPFFISVRAAATVLEITDFNKANAILKDLVRGGILTVMEPGKRGGSRATRFRIIASGSNAAAQKE